MRAAELCQREAVRPGALTGLIGLRIHTVAAVALARIENADTRPLLAELTAIDAAIAGPAGSTLRRLRDLFRLNAVELDLLSTCVGAAIDPSTGAMFAHLNAGSGACYVTEPLIACLFGHPAGRVWNPAGALALWGLVTASSVGPGEPSALSVDPVLPAWLDGTLWIDRELAGVVRNAETAVVLPDWPVDALAGAVRRALSLGKPIRVALRGEAGSGRTLLAAAAAARASLPALVVETGDIGDSEWPSQYIRLQRLAAIGGMALIWTGAQVRRPWPSLVAPAPVHFVAVEPDQTLRALPGALSQSIDMPEPSIDDRRLLWTKLAATGAQWAPGAVDALAARYRLGVGDVAAIAAGAPPTPEAAAQAARSCHRNNADGVVTELTCPFTWEDLILPESLRTALRQFAFEAAARERVWEGTEIGRLFPCEIAVVGLFSGPSGTGKTMAAQVIAADLQLDLLRVDLAAVMSKYIGETAKNLNRVFAIARRRQAILLFDEADAHFTRRTDVKDSHDRYANADTNHLLQLIEAHRGIVILATNRRSDIDPAYLRRLRHVLEFPRPQPAERLGLWRQAISTVAPEQWSALASRVGELADAIDLSGAQIKNAALSALFIARFDHAPLQFSHVLRGIDRELVKEGRPLAARERERWLRHA